MSTTPIPTTPDRIVQIATGYMAAKQLFAASRVGLFRALAGGERPLAELAEAVGVDEQMTRILADAMNGAGLLERRDGRYSLAPDAADYLAGAGRLDLGPFLTFLDQISYEHWLQFDTTIDTATPGNLKMDDSRWSTFMNGVMTYNALHAAMLADNFDFGPYRRMLDLGGLSPEFAIAALRANHELSVRFVFAPDSTGHLTQALATANLSERATIQPAETTAAKPDGSHDIIMLNHVIHRFSAVENRAILANTRSAAADGATLLLLDFFLDEDERQRPIDARHAGEYFVIDGTVVWPQAEVGDWLRDAGWQLRDVLTLPGSPRVLVATAV